MTTTETRRRVALILVGFLVGAWSGPLFAGAVDERKGKKKP